MPRSLLALPLLVMAAVVSVDAGPLETQEVVVEIHAESTGFATKGWYAPPRITIKKGTEVKWINKHWRPRSVTSRTGRFDSGVISPGSVWAHKFESEGEYVYECYWCFCNPMSGRVVVKGG